MCSGSASHRWIRGLGRSQERGGMAVPSLHLCRDAAWHSQVGGKSHQMMSYGPLSGQKCHSWLGALGSGGIWSKSKLKDV